MTPEQWRNLTSSHKADLWGTLSQADKMAIIATDKDTLKTIAAETVNALPDERPRIPASVPIVSHVVASRRRYSPREVLAQVRDASCYSTMRGIVNLLTLVSIAGSVLLFAAGLKDANMLLLVIAVANIPWTLALREGALVLADFVDLELQREARARSGE